MDSSYNACTQRGVCGTYESRLYVSVSNIFTLSDWMTATFYNAKDNSHDFRIMTV